MDAGRRSEPAGTPLLQPGQTDTAQREQKMKQEYLDSISKSGLFRYLDKKYYEKAWEELNITVRKFSDRQRVYHQGEDVQRVGIVHSGLIQGEKFQEEGTAHLAHLYHRGETFAFEGAVSGGGTSPMDYTAAGETEVIFFDVKRIAESSFTEELMHGLLELLANDNIKKLYRIEMLSQRGLRDRLMMYFRIVSERNGSRTIKMTMNRQQMAYYLCVNRTALSHELNEMKREGIIEMSGKNITLL